MSTRSPTTISCFLGNSILPFAVAGRGLAVTARGLICSFGLVNGYQLRNPKPPCRRRESETHFFADLLVAQRPAERGSERNVARIDIHHFGQNDRVFIGILGIQI